MKIRLGLLLTIIAAVAAHAQTPQTKQLLQSEISSQLSDQTTGQITPSVMRGVLNDMVVSWQQYTTVNAQTGTTYVFLASDYGKLVTFNNSSAVSVTLPQATGAFSPWNAYVSNLGSGAVTITPTVSLINGASSLQVNPGSSVQIISDGTNYQIFSGGGGGGGGGVTSLNGLLGAVNLTAGSNITITPSGNNLSISASGGGGGGSPGGSNLSVQFNNSGSFGGTSVVNNAVVCTNGSGSPSECTAIPNGVTGTTQTSSDNTTKLATTAFVQSVFSGSAVSSVFGRSGAVVAQTGDYTFAQIGSTPTTVAGYGITNALVTTNNLSDLTNSAMARTNLSLGTFATQNFATPPAIGGSLPNAGSFTTLSTSSTTNIINGPFQFNGNTLTLPSSAATLSFQVGTWTPGDCLQVANGTPGQNGGVADSGVSGCSGGGGGGGSVAHTQDFVGGVNFTPGVTTALTLSSIPASANSLVLTFDGVTQSHNSWSLNLTNGVVSFDAAIPAAVQNVEAQWLTTAVGVITGLTGDVTASGSGTVTATIAANAVTYAKFQQVAGSSLVGNPTGSLANAEGITLGTTLNFSGTTLNATTATSSQLGVSRPDNSTITISGGVLTAIGGLATSISATGGTAVVGGSNGNCLVITAGNVGNTSCGSATSVTVGTTNITSGTPGDFLYNNGGVLGNKALAMSDLPPFVQAMTVIEAARLAGPMGFMIGAL